MKVLGWWISLCTMWPVLLSSQVQVTGEFARDTIEIGQEIELRLSVVVAGDVDVIAIPSIFIDSLYSAFQTLSAADADTSGQIKPVRADYDIISYGSWSEPRNDGWFNQAQILPSGKDIGGQKIFENTFTIRIWDPGEVFALLPPVLYEIDGVPGQFNKRGVISLFVSPPVGLREIAQDSLDLSPIKTIVEEGRDITDYLAFIYGAAALFILAIFYLIFSKWSNMYKDKDEVKSQPRIPPHEQALQALDELRRAKLWQSGDIKSYQSGLTYIIRQYLENRYGIKALEETTGDIIDDMKKLGLEASDLTTLSRVLRVADLVKFAKATPEISIHDEFMEEAGAFVNKTRTTDEAFEHSPDIDSEVKEQ